MPLHALHYFIKIENNGCYKTMVFYKNRRVKIKNKMKLKKIVFINYK